MLLPFLASLLYYVLLAGHPVAMAIYTATKVFTIVWPIIAVVMIEQDPIWLGAVKVRKHVASLPMGLVTGLLIAGVIIGGYGWTSLGDYVDGFTGEITLKVEQMGIGDPVRYIVFCTFLAGLHSLIEEFFWRWYVFGRLVRVMPAGWAGLLASLAFAGHHYVVLGCYFSPTGTLVFGTGVGIGGALWCWMLRRQKTLLGCWLSHALVDVAVFAVGYRIVFG